MSTQERPNTINWELGYKLIEQYVSYNWSKFTSLHGKMDKEDAVQSIALKFVEKNYLEQYDPNGTSPNWFIAKAVYRWFVDETRKNRIQTISTETVIGEDIVLGDTLADDSDFEEAFINRDLINYIMCELPMETESTVLLMVPGQEDHRFSLRNLFKMLQLGFNVKEITSMTLNPANGKPCTSSRVSAELKKLREFASYLV